MWVATIIILHLLLLLFSPAFPSLSIHELDIGRISDCTGKLDFNIFHGLVLEGYSVGLLFLGPWLRLAYWSKWRVYRFFNL